MNLNNLLKRYEKHPHHDELVLILNSNQNSKIHLKGLFTSASSLFTACCINKTNKTSLFILPDKEEAAYFHNDLEKLLENEEVLFLPSSFHQTGLKLDENKLDSTSGIMRTEVLNKTSSTNKTIIISYPEAIIEKVITRNDLDIITLNINKGEQVPRDFVVEMLIEFGFTRVDFVYQPGQYAARGSIIDIFSFSNDSPYRIDFFGDEVETIRTFDIATQLSKTSYDKISVIPDIQDKINNKAKISFLQFLPENTIIWSNDLNYVIERIKVLTENKNSENFTDYTEINNSITNFKTIEFSLNTFHTPYKIFEFNISRQPEFNKNFTLLAEHIQNSNNLGIETCFMSENEKQFERLNSIFNSSEIGISVKLSNLTGILHHGFSDKNLRINCFTDHQIFDRYHKYKLKTFSLADSKENLTIQEINNLQPGDYVVHTDYGIGIFGGLQPIDVQGRTQEVIRLVYKDNDILLVNIHNLHKISKYKGKDGTPPKVYKLGTAAWSNLKNKTKSRVKDIAKDLIALYAMRKEQRGFAFSPDTYLQAELESSFIYDDTPDQIKATEAVKKDMEMQIPMDRLICGDVGFGKTEIAIRAAFKAVTDSKQVAVLVPTTVLALQHFKTFSSRLKDFPCNIEYISRMRSSTQIKIILEKLSQGKIDIIIGTHRLISKDIIFKDLGLLIVDEEQKFGVAVKERLKNIKLNVDTLTLTATPIPRTLQFSMMGARDLSIINTPPQNRYPITTELYTLNEEIIKNAINFETQRNGQVFFIHNRVDNLKDIQKMINRLCPNVTAITAHGQMAGHELEEVMMDFINEQYDVLIATTIIESGLDIPNANTIIINNAQNFGLSDLHQLRGRVGRSNKKAFCYLFAPPLTVVSHEARQRLKAIEYFSELGSGFNIAMQDLDIRGAGNLLGGEQSGFIADIGFETYHRILDEALMELRENEFQAFYSTDDKNDISKIPEHHIYVTDCQIETDLEVLFPENYIENIAERLKLYRELDKIDNDNDLTDFKNRLIDRFGKIPEQSIELLEAVRLRKYAIYLGIEKIIIKNGKLICFFITNQDSSYYNSPVFSKIIAFVQKYPKKVVLVEKNEKLSINFNDIKTIRSAIQILKTIQNDEINDL